MFRRKFCKDCFVNSHPQPRKRIHKIRAMIGEEQKILDMKVSFGSGGSRVHVWIRVIKLIVEKKKKSPRHAPPFSESGALPTAPP